MFDKSVTDLINERFSCRRFDGRAIPPLACQQLEAFIAALPAGPFGSRHRFSILAAREEDASMLKGLGAYGFVQGFSAFAVGTLASENLEDFGYQMELVALKATELGLGSCWLGGSFNKSRFARAVDDGAALPQDIPAVLALGNIPLDRDPRTARLRVMVGGAVRKPWTELFFRDNPANPLAETEAGAWAPMLEALRRAPSASNMQPWRLVRTGPAASPTWHLYLKRTPGYSKGLLMKLLKVADLQRIDMGIAMSHWGLAVQAAGWKGQWAGPEAVAPFPGTGFEPIAAWVGAKATS